ncbi:hypothetical protein PQO03_01830 [Lentisphaera profundi]|uniref:Rod shape-determining protein MreD n=1 Tax=Lentisphaera profundi TaxID=1658616 RepID=A0ABY7VR73_9BACT|nr:hypothetical protein [Lentisphaera profundi]WDE96705.1 hypothetical protein PQO03_01830 [Lentisphaera profundi]
MAIRSLSFYVFNFFFVVWVESFCASKSLFLPLSAIYIFYLTVARGIYQSLISMAVLMVLLEAVCGYNNLTLSLVIFVTAYFWRDMGDCQNFIPQILPIFIALFIAYILMFGLSDKWILVNVSLPSLVISSIVAPLFLCFWDFLSDSLSLSRFSVLDNYAEDL